MQLTKLTVEGFKNLRHVTLVPDAAYNLLLGENAQGKTNLLEAIWALTGCRSFRGTKERDYLPLTGGGLEVTAQFQDARRAQSLRLVMRPSGSAPEKKFWCNEVPRKPSDLFSIFHCVVFTPEDLALVSGGPERRRSFLDLCSAQLHAPVLSLVRRYQLALHQRNAVLKQHLPAAQVFGMLDVFDKQLVSLGTELSIQRAAYIQQLSAVCVPLYSQIAGGREAISLHYQSGIYGRDAHMHLPDAATPDIAAQYGEKLQHARPSDLVLGHTSAGAHRDDLLLYIDGKSAREFGSQGQKKSLALALKLAQAQIYSQRRRESPIVLLDDVMGELDDARQAVVSTVVSKMQVFVTTCHPAALVSPTAGKRFLLKQGELTPWEENLPEIP